MSDKYGKYGLLVLDEMALEALANAIECHGAGNIPIADQQSRLRHSLAAFLVRAQMGGGWSEERPASAWVNPAPDAEPSRLTTGVSHLASISAADRFPPTPKIEDYPECLEVPARAIAAVKRGLKPNDPKIDKIWATYKGQAKACILAFLEESAARHKQEKAVKPRYVPRARGLSTRPL